MTPAETLAMAQSLLDRPDARTAGIWPRAAALLARQALEQGLDAYWRGRGVALHNIGTRPQLICLLAYLPDTDVAARASHAWSCLTRACHHHPYELPPGHAELKSSLDAVAQTLSATAPEQRAT
jgi:hypothetical protein